MPKAFFATKLRCSAQIFPFPTNCVRIDANKLIYKHKTALRRDSKAFQPREPAFGTSKFLCDTIF
jgi:hypothetical protein